MSVTYVNDEIDASSGKGAGDENFPVGSFLIKPALRPHIFAYYRFARAADDIADNVDLSPDEKVRRLDACADVLTGKASGIEHAQALRASLADVQVSANRGLDLLAAFKQDAHQQRYANMDELLGYCALSANPVGRYLLDLHGEDPALYPASDALCSSLQILNHLQDCGDDRRELDRVYVPTDWLKEVGETIEALDRPAASPGLRTVMDRMLDVCDELNTSAANLEKGLQSRRLAAESGVITRLAKRLTNRLREGDPLATRIDLSKADFALSGLGGVWAALMPRQRAI